MTNNQPVYFIRHCFTGWTGQLQGKEEVVTKTFFSEKTIFIDYDFNENPNEINGRGVGSAHNRFAEINANGALVVAKYKLNDEDKILIGEVKPNSLAIDKRDWGTGEYSFRSFSLTKAKEITASDFPLAFFLTPRSQCVCHWQEAELAVNDFYNNHYSEPKLEYMLPCLQETDKCL